MKTIPFKHHPFCSNMQSFIKIYCVFLFATLFIPAITLATDPVKKNDFDNSSMKADSISDCSEDILPFYIQDYYLTQDDEEIVLNWTSQIQEGISEFVIERTSSIETRVLGKVDVKQQNSMKFQFSDIRPATGILVYEIYSRDFEGKTCLVGTERIDYQMDEKLEVKLFPNPLNTGDQLNIEFITPEQKIVNISIIDQYGKIILTEKVDLESNWNNMNIETDKLTSGLYYLIINDSGKQSKYPFWKNK